jgi:hypothetical protein
VNSSLPEKIIKSLKLNGLAVRVGAGMEEKEIKFEGK